MMRLPPEVKPGDPVRADDYNALLRYVRSLLIRSGVGYMVDHTTAGQLLKIRDRAAERGKKPAGAFGYGYIHPFQGFVTDDDEITVYKGDVWGLEGWDSAISHHVKKSTVAIDVSSGTEIWLKIEGDWQGPTAGSSVDKTHDHAHNYTHDHTHDAIPVSSPHGNEAESTKHTITVETMRFRPVSATFQTTTPTKTIDGGDWETASTPWIYVKILEFTNTGGDVVIDHQCIHDDIFMTEIYVEIT